MFNSINRTIKTIFYKKTDIERFQQEKDELEEKGFEFKFEDKYFEKDGETYIYNSGFKK